jgi:outer membrane protein OmpA-like peptidoglycan-associated protein
MKRQDLVRVTLGAASIALLSSACATKGFVREQLGTAETRISQRLDSQEMQLQQTSERALTNSQAIDSTSKRMQGMAERLDATASRAGEIDSRVGGIDTRVGQVGVVANDAKRQADTLSSSLQDTETRLSQRLASRNDYAVLDTKSVYFESDKADLREIDTSELQDIVTALKANPNAIVELRGFADPRGSERYNYRLTRDRVDAVARYLVQRHGIDLRRIYAVGLGKEVVDKPGQEAFAKSRRVDIRLLATQS